MLSRPPFPRPSEALADKLRARLHRVLGPSKLITAEDGCRPYGGDRSAEEPVTPDAVVLAQAAGDVERTLAIAGELEVPVTPRAGGTGKSGGAVPICGGIALCTLGLGDIKEIDAREQLAVVGPGVILADLWAAVEGQGLFYPPDPASCDACALGGNIAENAGGPRAFKYGVTRDYVLGLAVVTAEGTRLGLGRRTVKGVTGYDLTGLLVGSEGTLAVITEATLRLLPKPAEVRTLLGLFATVRSAAAAVAAIVAAGLVPCCLELLDGASLEALRRQGIAVDRRAGALLLIEVDGDEPACRRMLERVGDAVTAAGALSVRLAFEAGERERLWTARRQLSEATRALARHKLSEDVAVPRGRLAELIEELPRLAERHRITILSYGHAGDGNLHVSLLWDEPEQQAGVAAARAALLVKVLALGGTLTGEHGIGSTKASFLSLEQQEELISLQRNIKKLFDPKGILNPGKIFVGPLG